MGEKKRNKEGELAVFVVQYSANLSFHTVTMVSTEKHVVLGGVLTGGICTVNNVRGNMCVFLVVSWKRVLKCPDRTQ